MTEFSTDFDKCLCCGQPITERRPPITPERAPLKAYGIFLALGLTRETLLSKLPPGTASTTQSPGPVEWLEGQVQPPENRRRGRSRPSWSCWCATSRR